MSSKARALFKKLRAKANEEKEKERNETPEPSNIRKNEIIGVKKLSSSVPKNIIKEKDEIDPLDYFKTEHIKIEASDMKEYANYGITKDSDDEKEKEKKKEEKKKNEVVIDLKTGMMGPTSHKINFMEMMKARNKIKKDSASIPIEEEKKSENKKIRSVGKRKTRKEENPVIVEEKKEDKRIKIKSVEKNPDDNSKSLYVKLILARNRFSSKKNPVEENVYQNIIDLLDEINSIKDLPEEIANEVNNLMKKLEFPPHLIIDNDVQDYIPEDKFVPLVTNPIPLEQVLKKMNLS